MNRAETVMVFIVGALLLYVFYKSFGSTQVGPVPAYNPSPSATTGLQQRIVY